MHEFNYPVRHTCISILVSSTERGRFKPFYCNDKYFLSLNSVNSMKAFRKNSTRGSRISQKQKWHKNAPTPPPITATDHLVIPKPNQKSLTFSKHRFFSFVSSCPRYNETRFLMGSGQKPAIVALFGQFVTLARGKRSPK